MSLSSSPLFFLMSASACWQVEVEFATTMAVVADSSADAVEAVRLEFSGCTLISVQVRNFEEAS